MKLRTAKTYTQIVGTLLFLLGILGFAFPSAVQLPDVYLLLFLALGFWGVLVSVYQKKI
jgi:hypothetical protein